MSDDRPISEVERANYWLEHSDVDSVEEGITWDLIDDLAREIERLESLVAEAVRVIQHLADQQAMLDGFYKETLSRLEDKTNE